MSKAKNLQVEKKKLRMNDRGIFDLLFHSLITFKVTGNILDEFFFVNLNSIPVTLRVGIGLISKELVDSFGVDRLS